MTAAVQPVVEPNAAATLEMVEISKTFPGVRALIEARLSVRSGEVMALMGANGAGKSTLMNVLGGVIAPDNGGSIKIDGRDVILRSPRAAAEAGVAFVHQELTMFGTMSVLENIFMDACPGIIGRSRRRTMMEQAKALLARVGADVDPLMPVEQLGTGDKQLIEIARALRDDPKILIFDEPTSSLTERERTKLFQVIHALRTEGTAVIYISHFIDEIFQVCDRLTVMRDGKTVAETDIASVTSTDVVRLMLGPTEAQGRIRPASKGAGAEVLRVANLNRTGAVHDIAFSLHAGEIVGLWGLLGSGRTELIRAVVGLDPVDSGDLHLRDGDTLAPIGQRALRNQIGLVTEDRRGEGIIAPQSIVDNAALPNALAQANQLGIENPACLRRLAVDIIARLSIKTSGPDQKIGTLSGGNQQKVVMGRWLQANPKVFFLDEPTRGLDVKAKADILKLVAELADNGCAVLVVSSELAELMRICDRYLVLSRGRIVHELPGSASEDDLMGAVG